MLGAPSVPEHLLQTFFAKYRAGRNAPCPFFISTELHGMDSRLSIGVAQFNAGRFFVAHEVWEALWDEAIPPEKSLLRGLVQIAAGYAKVESGIGSGALKLLARGVEQVRPFLPASLGLDLVGLVDGVTADIARLRTAPADSVGLEMVRPPQLDRF